MRLVLVSAATVLVACGVAFDGTDGAGGSAAATAGGTGGTSTASGGATSVGGEAGAGAVGGQGGGVGGGAGPGGGGAGGASVPADCQEVLDADPGASSGDHVIDPDGAGPVAPFTVRCDMDVRGGGWTRFHWLGAPFVDGTDPLGQALDACEVNDISCFGRIPASAMPVALLVKDTTDDAHAVFPLGGAVGAAMIGALRDKQEVCVFDGAALAAVLDTSQEEYCADGWEGGCDSFFYTSGSCGGGDGWLLEFDGDGYACRSAFKLGRTSRDGAFGDICGVADHGYLDECDCTDEYGELYYR
ncbi:MAG: fibrinogen-like YCDxxxxGGGW domain-containing protein [Polyangiaceae bacterium]